jgi:hypothetical protein
VLVKNKITGFNELTGPDTHAIADGADDFAVACKFEELPILAATHPGIAFVVKVQCADEISHRQGLLEYPIGRINNNAIELNIPSYRIEQAKKNQSKTEDE